MKWKELFWPTKSKLIFAVVLFIILFLSFYISPVIAFIIGFPPLLLWGFVGNLGNKFPIFFYLIPVAYLVGNALWAYFLSCILLFLWKFVKIRLSKKYYPLMWIFVIAVLVMVYASWTGLPVPAMLEGHGCSVDYRVLLVPNMLCQFSTGGHCSGNYLITNNAEAEFADCLCNKYNESPSQEIEETVDELCSGNEFCMRECKENKELTVNEICQEENRCFHRLYIL